MSRLLNRTWKTRFWRFSHVPFFALGKFTADFENDAPRGNASASKVHGKLLSSHAHWKPLSVLQKSFLTKGFPLSRTRADRFILGNSWQCEATYADVPAEKFYYCFAVALPLWRNGISFSFRMLPRTKASSSLRTTFWKIHYWFAVVCSKCNFAQVLLKKCTVEYSAVFHC